jgi:hypothetical protein
MNYVAAELSAQLQATKDLIEAEGQPIVLMRPAALQADGTGGFVTPLDQDAPLASQDLFFGLVQYEPLQLDYPTGQTIHVKFVLVGMPDADIQEGDWFTLYNKRYIVQKIAMTRGFEMRAEGEVPDDGRVE